GGNTDDLVSRHIARELGLDHLRVPATPLSIAGEVERNRLTHFCADEHGWILSLRDALRGRVQMLYDGLAGDVLSAGMFLSARGLELMRTGKFRELARHLVDEEALSPFVSRLLRNEAGQGGEATAIARIA